MTSATDSVVVDPTDLSAVVRCWLISFESRALFGSAGCSTDTVSGWPVDF
ncbi:MAG: hypothetical protein FWD57_08335 [Polyangiaceae bacterium]|nr:hypothetical protein [Polyangiaceae bacterium]